ncbi:MAG: hypothetical protein ACYCUV_11520 [Phycisphaerae bacterium]
MWKRFLWIVVMFAVGGSAALAAIKVHRMYQREGFYRRAYLNTNAILYGMGMWFPFGRAIPGKLCHMSGGGQGWLSLRLLGELRFDTYLDKAPRLAGAVAWKSRVPRMGTTIDVSWVGRLTHPAVLKVSRLDGHGSIKLPIYADYVSPLLPGGDSLVYSFAISATAPPSRGFFNFTKLGRTHDLIVQIIDSNGEHSNRAPVAWEDVQGRYRISGDSEIFSRGSPPPARAIYTGHNGLPMAEGSLARPSFVRHPPGPVPPGLGLGVRKQ